MSSGQPFEVASQYDHELPDDIEERFLRQIRTHGNVVMACLNLQVPRQTLYARRWKDPDFADRWEQAMSEWSHDFKQAIIATAAKLGVGRMTPVLDDDGNPVLDENGEVVHEVDARGIDVKVTNKLLDKVMQSADGPAQTLVQVNNNTAQAYDPNRLPELVLEDTHALEAPKEALLLPKLSDTPRELQIVPNPDQSDPDDAWLFE